MSLEDYGFSDDMRIYIEENGLGAYEPGRVLAEHKERYIVVTENGEYEAEITGNMRFGAESREDFPAVGDWVAAMVYEPDTAIIHHILPRYSLIRRRAAGHAGEFQVIAANIDYAFLVQAADRDFNINRLERYLTICSSAGVSPVITLSKIDLISRSRLDEILGSIQSRIAGIPVVAVSNQTIEGIDSILSMIEKGRTYCLLGSSGVGKSSLINNLAGRSRMSTDAVSTSTGKGRHVTTHREMILLEGGGILIDNPGMREVGITDDSGGLESTFGQIAQLSALCRFQDCSHTSEPECAVLKALNEGTLDRGYYENYMKMEKERMHYVTSSAEKKKKERVFGKILKDYKKNFSKSGR